MPHARFRRTFQRSLTTGLVTVLAASVVTALAAPSVAAPARPDWVDELEDAGRRAAPAALPWRGSSPSAPLAKSTGLPAPEVDLPAAGRWEVPLAGGTAKAVDDRPVRVTAKGAAAPEDSVAVEVFDQAAARRVGASGFVFRVSGERAKPVTVSVDYSGFEHAHGADYADRLRVVALPACALAVPRPAGCAPGKSVPARNDRAARTLTLESAGVTTFAVTSSPSGDTGTFAASPMPLSGSWQVAPGSGAFSYSYPIDVPAPAGGTAPSVSLGYSSAAVDGLTFARNTQASPNGIGWSDFANAYIERSYEPCIGEPVGTTDLCWKTENATISLAGIAGSLLPTDGTHTRWRAQADPGWRIERLTGAANTTVHQRQWWKVIGPDGTQYFFGSGDANGRPTNATLGVQVVANHSGEPCRAAGDEIGGCEQGWRWYLDRVVDPDGNVQSLLYEREDNWYHSLLGALGGRPLSKYHRGALLKEIIYGGRGQDPNSYAARVLFGLEYRCGFLVPACPAPTPGHSGFPDVPTDLVCAGSGTCGTYAPSFFTSRRYAHVRAEVKIGTAWEPVAQHNILHSFGDGANGVSHKLQVSELQHAGIAFDGLNAYPTTKFTHAWLDNRADHEGNIPKAMRHNRIATITNPFGGKVSVEYFQNRDCPADHQPVRWDQNTMDCFPQSIKDGSHTGTGLYNKYLVRRVTESAGLGSPDIATTYTYLGTPAWAFDTGAFARDDDELAWAVWRGYDTVQVAKGSSRTLLRVFRGWNDDIVLANVNGDLVPIGRRAVVVEELGRPGVSHVDHPALAGRVLEQQQLGTLNGVSNTVLHATRHEYVRRVTDIPGDYYFDAEWSAVASTTERVATAPGAFRERRSRTTYNDHFQPATTLEEGWLDVTGDERCSVTTYADNTAIGMVGYPAANTSLAGGCDSTEVLSRSETYYDGSTTLGAPPTRGNATRQRTQLESGRWATTTAEYDALGRPVRATDARGGATTTAYAVTAGAPASQLPVRATVTNALGQQAVTDLHPQFGVPKRQQDANGKVTEHWYDEFGRATAVWLPTEPLAFAEPSWKFSYDIPNRTVRTQRLVSDARTGNVVFEEAWVVHDGFWRERQAQSVSPAAGKALVTETTYDNGGQVRDETVEQALAGTPGTYLAGGSSWLNRTRHAYDELGRQVREEWFRGAAPAHATTTAYGADTVTVTGPDGRQVRERVDAHGRTTAVEEFDGEDWVSSSYRYDLADRLTSVTDPAGNRTSYSYNLAGWRTSQQDPNRGAATFGHDDAGNVTSARDALGNELHTAYDALSRPVERRSGSPTGTLRASWQYDTAPGGKGKIHRETTHTAGGDWVTETLGYDDRGRPTGTRSTVPAGIPGLSGTYQVSQVHDRADRVRSVTYPAIGGLPAETVTTEYDRFGLPARMAGLAEYVWGSVPDDRGRRVSAGLGPRPGGTTWLARSWSFDLDQRTDGSETVLGSTVVADHEVEFDAAGNPTEKLTRQGGASWRECFGYDPRARLTEAHTVPATSACTGTPGTGDRPYAHTYEYSADGNLRERVENGDTTTYAYPAAGQARPNAPTRVDGVDYTWDGRGNLLTRGGETFSWDVQGVLSSVTTAGGTTSFTHDASGQRLLRRTPDGRSTLYLAGHEITADAGGTVVAAVRPYTFDGELVATRSLSGVDYLVADPAGSVEVAVPSGGQAPSATRAYEPYGQARGGTGDPATDRGFLGQVEDSSTGLSYLNARYYDPDAAVFVSADPLYDTGKVKTLNPYSYASNNPVGLADPSGLMSSYTWGLETENAELSLTNQQLLGHIGWLNTQLEGLQKVIINDRKEFMAYARAAEAELSRRAGIIRHLEGRVAYLNGVVAQKNREISRLKGVISYYRGIVNQLGFRLWGGTSKHAEVMDSIHSFRGIPAGAFDHDRISQLEAAVSLQEAAIAGLGERFEGMRISRNNWRDTAKFRDGRDEELMAAFGRLKSRFGRSSDGPTGGGGGGSWDEEGGGFTGQGVLGQAAEGCVTGLAGSAPLIAGGAVGWAAVGSSCVGGALVSVTWNMMF